MGDGRETAGDSLFLEMLATSIRSAQAPWRAVRPTLVMGAMYGGAFGLGFHALFPRPSHNLSCFVLLG